MDDASQILEFHRRKYGNPDYQTKYPGIRFIQDKHREIVRLVAAGFPIDEVARRAGCTPNWVRQVVNSRSLTDHMAHLRAMRDDAVVRSTRVLSEAAEAIAHEMVREALDEANPLRERRALFDSILDRTGVSRITKTEQHTAEERHVTIEHIRRLAEETKDNPNIIDIELNESPVPLSPSATQPNTQQSDGGLAQK